MESVATLSNCGDLLKLSMPNCSGNTAAARVNSPGYGNNLRDVTMDNPQPTPKDLQPGLRKRFTD